MQVTQKTIYVVYPAYASQEIAYGNNFIRSSLTPVDVEIAGIPMPGMHSVPLTVWELDEGFSSNLSQYFTTAEDMWLYLENLGFDRQTIKNYNFHYLPYKTPTLSKGWLDNNPYKDKMAELGPQVQYYPASSILVNKAQTSGDVPNLYIENMVWGGYLGLCPKPVSQTTQIWGTKKLQYFRITGNTPTDADPLTSDSENAVPPIVCTGPIGTDNYTAGPKYAGISNTQANRTGVSIPILYRAPIPTDPTHFYYGVIMYGYRYNDNRYFLYTKAFGYKATTSSSYTVYSSTQANMLLLTQQIDAFFGEAIHYVPPAEDPYESIAESETGGGEGTLDWTSDEITDDSSLIYTPAIADGPQSGGVTPLYNVYYMGINPSISLGQLHSYMWTNSSFLDAITKANADIRQSIISLHALPYICTFDAQTSYPIVMCGQETTVNALKGVPQKEEFDLGSIEIKEFYGSYLDYSPYTSVSIYLPFIGHRDLPVDKVMGKTINVKYTFDNYTGNCMARVLAGNDTIDCYNGQCALTYPMTGADFSQKLAGTIMTIGGVAALGAGLLSMGGAFAGAASLGLGAPTAAALTPGLKAAALGASSMVMGQGINASKSSVYHNSNLGGSVSWYAYRTPYLTITSPRLAHPLRRNVIMGGRVRRTVKVKDLSGFTQFDEIHIDTVVCSDAERTMLKRMLIEGVIL